jgi:hypothetical protein
VARIAPNVLVTSDLDLLRRMYAVRSPYSRSDWYMAWRFNPGYDNVLSQRDNDKHAELRAKLAIGVSGRRFASITHLRCWREIDGRVSGVNHVS